MNATALTSTAANVTQDAISPMDAAFGPAFTARFNQTSALLSRMTALTCDLIMMEMGDPRRAEVRAELDAVHAALDESNAEAIAWAGTAPVMPDFLPQLQLLAL